MNSNETKKRQRRRNPPNLYFQYRLLHVLWGSIGEPSKECTKTALQMAMNLNYRSFKANFDFALGNGLISSIDKEWATEYRITDKGVKIHNHLELIISILYENQTHMAIHDSSDENRVSKYSKEISKIGGQDNRH